MKLVTILTLLFFVASFNAQASENGNGPGNGVAHISYEIEELFKKLASQGSPGVDVNPYYSDSTLYQVVQGSDPECENTVRFFVTDLKNDEYRSYGILSVSESAMYLSIDARIIANKKEEVVSSWNWFERSSRKTTISKRNRAVTITESSYDENMFSPFKSKAYKDKTIIKETDVGFTIDVSSYVKGDTKNDIKSSKSSFKCNYKLIP